jgi:hypothetical protein
MPLSATLFTGCSDFLDILPMNEVVLENYWKEKADVTSAVNGCYEALASQDVVTRFGVWGELRSDNMIAGNATPNDINEILKENLLPSNSLCDWSKVYNVINRCNIVCHYAPEVADIDPNYTTDELNATIAEMVAIRSLCYFYLIRTFRDVPYTTQPTISDDQTFILPATPFNAVLDSLINDLDKVKDNALRRTSQERVSGKTIVVPEENNSRITRWAIYALLADLYLWKGDWDNAIKCCDAIFAYKKEIYDELVLQDQINDVALYHDIPLILESSDKSQNVGNTYRKIFGTGNSFESIFEIYYTGNADQNNWVDPYYTDGNTVMGRLKAADFLMEGFTTDNNQVFLSQTDCRAYENMRASGTSYAIAKYARTSANFSLQKLGSVTVSDSYRASKNANWIFYRLTDVMLMKAEALIERGEEDFPAAFELIDDVYRRANNIEPESTAKSLDIASYSISKPKMEDLLFEERHRELMFEGKRWFDLVRATQREEETTRLSLNVMRKHQQDVNVIKIKLADPNYIYFPYARKELKANPLLVQNPAYNKGDEGVLQ